MTSPSNFPCRIGRLADYQGPRPSVSSQAEVEKCVTGCDGLSPSTTTSGTRTELSTASPNCKQIQYNNLKIATINVRTLQDDIKLATVIKTAEDLQLDILALQETRRPGFGLVCFEDESLKGWKLVWSGTKRKKIHGVGILLAPHVRLNDYKEHHPARILSATVSCKGLNIAILNGYAPIDNAGDGIKLAFYSSLGKAKQHLDAMPKFKVITVGDFNATISSSSKDSGAWDYVLGYNNSDRVDTSNNGERFLGWCLKHKMKIMNSMFRTKRVHRGTWMHPRSRRWKRVDYMCTTEWMSKFVKLCRVFIGPSVLFDTDHRLLVMEIMFPVTKRHLQYHLSRRPKKPDVVTTDFVSLRKNDDLQRKLTERIDRSLEAPFAADVNELNDRIVNVMKESVTEVCPKLSTTRKKEPWENEELNEMMKDLKKTRNLNELRRKKKEIKEKRKAVKNEYFKELADEINTVAEAREVEKEFALAKKHSAFKSGQPKAISNEKLKKHFQDHFDARSLPLPPELEHPENFQHLYQDRKFSIKETPPDANEIKDVLKTFKNGKSAGTDKVKTEGLKYNNSTLLINAILTLLTLIWTTLSIPSVWLHANITCLYKKGAMSVASNYRGISISANMSRILAKVIINRLKEAYENHLGETQFGFRKNRSTGDAIFVLKSVIEKHGGQLLAVYIDLTAAYDHIPRDFLFRVLTLRTGATHLVNILRKMYEGTTATIKGSRAVFDVLIGCRQGGQESPCLFNYYFDYVLKVAAHEIDQHFPNGWGIDFDFRIPHYCTNRQQRTNGRMNGIQTIRWILYADDAVLFCKTPDEAFTILSILNETCKRFGLTISFKKTKTQAFKNKELAERESLFSIDKTPIENVKEFCYLGQIITNSEDDPLTEYRVARANAKFNQLRDALCDYNINIYTRKKLLEACVRSRLTYGLQACYPKEAQLKKLEACWSQCLRSMIKGGWRRLEATNEETEEFRFFYSNRRVEKLTKTSPLRNYITEQYLRYTGHICRAENYNLPKIMLFAEPTQPYYRDPWVKIAQMLGTSIDQAKRTTQDRAKFAGMVSRRTSPP